jgi:hypothetical protein
MKQRGQWLHWAVWGLFLIFPSVSRAEPTTSFEAGLFHPLQTSPDDTSVVGFRFDLVYGVNDNLQGIDIGLWNETRGNAHGFELGADNRTGRNFGGAQVGLFNDVKRDFKGLQLGLIANVTRRTCEGFQASVFFNEAEDELRGVQLGIVNHTGSLYGLQIGLINLNDDKKYVGFMPFINAVF